MPGEMDIVKRDHTDQLAHLIPRSEEYIVKGTTHALIWEKPDIVNAKVLEFLDGAFPR
jgi:pimeloyl-ACP methyl ester carboxylesterase